MGKAQFMIYIVIGMGLLFLGIGFILTENNAKYMLAGYNSSSEEERKKVDLKTFIPFYRRFHIILGVSFLIIGSLLYYLVGETAAGIFLGVYPVLAYIYFIAMSGKHASGSSSKMNKVGIGILIATLVLVLGTLGYGSMESNLTYDKEAITISGSYGQELPISEVKSMELVDKLPSIKFKKNGFAMGTTRKGYFRTRDGEAVKLITDVESGPYLLFTLTDGEKIYYASKAKSSAALLNELKAATTF